MKRKFFSGTYWFFEDTQKLDNLISPVWGLLPQEEIYSGKSQYQDIEVFQAEGYGRVMALDGLVQLSTEHEFVYHEMLTHPAILYHNDPKKVLIVGGGDGGALREIAKHPVKEILLVEIDQQVIEISKKYLPSLSRGAFEDPRLTVINDDAANLIKQYHNEFDLIISDSTDAFGASEALWSSPFYKLVLRALSEDGVACFQTGYFKEKFARKGRRGIKRVFPHSLIYRAHVGCFPFDECTFTVASETINFEKVGYGEIMKRYARSNISTYYYSPKIHFASQVIPKCYEDKSY
jgi:spermidine synthase